VERWGNGTDRGEWSVGGIILTGETEVLGEKPVPGPFCVPQISHGMIWERVRSSVSE
jgi:hypothetical protein